MTDVEIKLREALRLKPFMHLERYGPEMVEATIAVTCVGCRKETIFSVNANKIISWLHGSELIQNVWPEMSDADRELFISGMCGTCWDNLFKEAT